MESARKTQQKLALPKANIKINTRQHQTQRTNTEQKQPTTDRNYIKQTEITKRETIEKTTHKEKTEGKPSQ
jgi:hypothetical protein